MCCHIIVVDLEFSCNLVNYKQISWTWEVVVSVYNAKKNSEKICIKLSGKDKNFLRKDY